MPIDFFVEAHKTSSSAVKFGLCDDAPPAANPAYIDEINKTEWIGIVNNPKSIGVSFHPIDHCVDLRRANGGQAQRCDGLLKYGNNNIHFIELKDRMDIDTHTTSSGKIVLSWLEKGIEQLKETIKQFIAYNDQTSYSFQDCYVCNKQVFRKFATTHIARFKNDTGAMLGGCGLILCPNKNVNL